MMAKQLSHLEFVQANEAARAIEEAAIVAYWMAIHDHKQSVIHQRQRMREGLDRLCEIMGLRVVDAEEVSA